MHDNRLAKKLDMARAAQEAMLVHDWSVAEQRLIDSARVQKKKDSNNDAPAPGLFAGAKLKALQTLGQPKPAANASLPPLKLPASAAADIQPTDSLIASELTPIPSPFKGLVVRCYLRLKATAFVAVLGRHWLAKARWKRAQRKWQAMFMAYQIVASGKQTIMSACLCRSILPKLSTGLTLRLCC